MNEHAYDADGGSSGLTSRQRAEFRSFVRTHHPDRGGDPAAFVAGLAYYRDLAAGAATEPAGASPAAGRDRYDAPIEIVRDLPLPTKVLVALIRTIHRRRRTRVD